MLLPPPATLSYGNNTLIPSKHQLYMWVQYKTTILPCFLQQHVGFSTSSQANNRCRPESLQKSRLLAILLPTTQKKLCSRGQKRTITKQVLCMKPNVCLTKALPQKLLATPIFMQTTSKRVLLLLRCVPNPAKPPDHRIAPSANTSKGLLSTPLVSDDSWPAVADSHLCLHPQELVRPVAAVLAIKRHGLWLSDTFWEYITAMCMQHSPVARALVGCIAAT